MSRTDVERGNALFDPRRPAAPAALRIRRWSPFRNPAGTMLGFLSVELPSGLILNDCKVMIGPNGRPWIAMPAVKLVDRDGAPKLDANGKPIYAPIIEFCDRATADRFRDLVIDAVRRTHPVIFDGEAGAGGS